MFYGCNEIVEVGDYVLFRTGGGDGHTGEFIHTTCNDYMVDADNTVTSLWLVFEAVIFVVFIFSQIRYTNCWV